MTRAAWIAPGVPGILPCLLLIAGCGPERECREQFMQPGDELRVTVLENRNSDECGVLLLEPGMTFAMTVAGELHLNCTFATFASEVPAPFESVAEQCEDDQGLGLGCRGQLTEECAGKFNISLAYGSLTKERRSVEDGLMNVSWIADACVQEGGCQDQYAVRLEWVPKSEQ